MTEEMTIGKCKSEYVFRTAAPSRGNVRSAISTLTKALNLTDDDLVGELVKNAIRPHIAEFFEGRAQAVVPSTYASQTTHQLRFLRAVARGLGVDQPQTFGEELAALALFSGETARTLAAKVGVGRQAMTHWLAGKNQPRDRRVVSRLEQVLHVPQGRLMERMNPVWRRSMAQPRLTDYQARCSMRRLERDFYGAKQLPVGVSQMVRDVEEFRSARVIPLGLKRDPANIWRINEDGCVTGEMFRRSVNGLYGFLPRLGFDEATLSEAEFFRVDLWDKFVEFLDMRTEYRGGTSLRAIVLMPALFKRRTGYFWQQDKYSQFVNPAMDREQWQRHCQDVADHFLDAIKGLRHNRPKARNPGRDVKDILLKADPLEVLQLLFDRMRNSKPPSGRGGRPGRWQAIWARDCLLVGLLNWMPLRNRNWRIMTYEPDNTGHLYQADDGSWRLRFDVHEFKRSCEKEEFDVKVPDNLWDLIQEYLTVYRPLFEASRFGSIVFCSSVTAAAGRKRLDGRMTANSLSELILWITRRYLPQYPGFGPHAWRHILATAWRDRQPGLGKYLLNDSERVVRQTYEHSQYDRLISPITKHHEALGKKEPPRSWLDFLALQARARSKPKR